MSSIEDARGVFDLMNFRPTPDDLRRAQRVSSHEYDALQRDKIENVEEDEEEDNEETEKDIDRPKPGSYIQRRRRHLCSRVFCDHHIEWNNFSDHVIMELLRVTRNLCNAVTHARRYALNQLNTLIRPELESAWCWYV